MPRISTKPSYYVVGYTEEGHWPVVAYIPANSAFPTDVDGITIFRNGEALVANGIIDQWDSWGDNFWEYAHPHRMIARVGEERIPFYSYEFGSQFYFNAVSAVDDVRSDITEVDLMEVLHVQ